MPTIIESGTVHDALGAHEPAILAECRVAILVLRRAHYAPGNVGCTDTPFRFDALLRQIPPAPEEATAARCPGCGVLRDQPDPGRCLRCWYERNCVGVAVNPAPPTAILLDDVRDQLGTQAVRILNAFGGMTLGEIAAQGRQRTRRPSGIGPKSIEILDRLLAMHAIPWAPIVRCFCVVSRDCEHCDGTGWREVRP